jgi:hypothetical protein
MFKLKEFILLTLIVALTLGLVLVSSWTNGIVIFDNLSESINKQILYQSITLTGTIIFLSILWAAKRRNFLEYFRKGNISAEVLPEPFIGIKPKPTENWIHIGMNFAIVISLVTAIVIYLQLISESEFSIERIIKVLPFSIVFALSNSFVEECITRLGVVVVLKGVLKDKLIPFVSAFIFGTVHYWGNPGGFMGVVVAGFLGWFLAKSIIETRGIFWAWLIHFLQDVIIFSALLTIVIE